MPPLSLTLIFFMTFTARDAETNDSSFKITDDVINPTSKMLFGILILWAENFEI